LSINKVFNTVNAVIQAVRGFGKMPEKDMSGIMNMKLTNLASAAGFSPLKKNFFSAATSSRAHQA
jgi:hypothetical protein